MHTILLGDPVGTTAAAGYNDRLAHFFKKL
jgi:hypothetical protein